MKLSIIELGTVVPGTGEKDGLADALETARHADRAGFHRVWFAEHHLSRSGASHHPELLIVAAALQTTGIRVGSGAVLMNHYSPFKVAEMYQQLEAMFPGRIDLGMGRATAGPVIDLALQQDRSGRFQADHAQQVLETLAWLYGEFPAGHAFDGNPLMPSVPTPPQTWLLGSSPSGSGLAAALGIGYTFAAFINPPGAASALRNYRAQFQPQDHGLDEPRAILGVNVAVGEDAADGRRLISSAKGFYSLLRRGVRAATVPSAQEAAGLMSEQDREQPTSIIDGQWPQFVAGSPNEVRSTLEQMIERSGADEVMIQNMIADPVDRRGSHQRLAEMFGLAPRSLAGTSADSAGMSLR